MIWIALGIAAVWLLKWPLWAGALIAFGPILLILAFGVVGAGVVGAAVRESGIRDDSAPLFPRNGFAL